ncbi:MAG: multicopper oxidase domain-containing protein [Anaerolineae bacterium]|nr:multicopper oxidase domain-containing protein [Anaerolineae bacterium]
MGNRSVTRRKFIGLGLGATAGVVGAGLIQQAARAEGPTTDPHVAHSQQNGHANGAQQMVGTVDPSRNGFDPMHMLVDWDYGKVSTLPNGRTLREYDFSAGEHDIEIAPGIFFPAWSYNGRVPGPTIRCTEGDRIRVKLSNFGTHPHTIHFHGFHTAEMDGVPGIGAGEIAPGKSFTYEFDAEPFGCHLYHCHATPLKRHIHKGMYGAFIIDPKVGRPPAREFMMMMNAFDTNFDGGNEVYAVNTVGHEFMRRPIPAKVGELIRIYLINIVEFDLINSFHLHANFFDYYDTGTTLQPTLRMVDTIMQAQGQRGILEFKFRWPGQFMFHAHVSEFAELGWMGMFNAVEPDKFEAALKDAALDSAWDQKATAGSTTAQEIL